jgi:hypothetical protein
LFIRTDKARALAGEYINIGVGVTRDCKLKLEDLKTSHTLGGVGEGVYKGIPKDIEYIPDKRTLVGEEVEGAVVMKDEDLKLEEIEASHTLG